MPTTHDKPRLDPWQHREVAGALISLLVADDPTNNSTWRQWGQRRESPGLPIVLLTGPRIDWCSHFPRPWVDPGLLTGCQSPRLRNWWVDPIGLAFPRQWLEPSEVDVKIIGIQVDRRSTSRRDETQPGIRLDRRHKSTQERGSSQSTGWNRTVIDRFVHKLTSLERVEFFSVSAGLNWVGVWASKLFADIPRQEEWLVTYSSRSLMCCDVPSGTEEDIAVECVACW